MRVPDITQEIAGFPGEMGKIHSGLRMDHDSRQKNGKLVVRGKRR